MNIYKTIEKMAYEQKKTVARVEREAGLSKGTINKWKTSSPTVCNLSKVVSVLGITIDELIRE